MHTKAGPPRTRTRMATTAIRPIPSREQAAVPSPAAHGVAVHDVALSLVPDDADSRRPFTASSPPHRPPIA